MRLENKVALITGAGSGIGRATAELFGREGANVVVSDVNEADVLETADMVKAAGSQVAVVTGDVANSADAERMVKATVDAFGRIDVLVNSAGVTGRNALPEGASPEEIWDRVIDVNLKGTYLVSWYAVPEMERSGGGSIVNLGSVMSVVGYPAWMGGGFNPYGPSKGGVIQFTRNLATESASKNIRVNCICPGFVETKVTRVISWAPSVLRICRDSDAEPPVASIGSSKTKSLSA